MEMRTVEGNGGVPVGGFVVEMLGKIDVRPNRHRACERMMAILEEEVDRLGHEVDVLSRRVNLLMLDRGLRRAFPHGLPTPAQKA